MSERYLVEILQAQITPITVVANTPQETIERTLKGEVNPGGSWHDEPKSTCVVKLGS